MKRPLLLFIIIVFPLCLWATEDDTSKKKEKTPQDTVQVEKIHQKRPKEYYIPKFTATILARYEFNTNTNKHHFELRHTRIGVSGNVHPMFSYMALVDLTYGGKFSPVTLFAKFKPVKGLSFILGYDKLPFSNENLLSPYQYYFSDKSFLTQKITAWSDVGFTVVYEWNEVIPFEIKAGVYNSGGFDKQIKFQEALNYDVRGLFRFFKGFDLTLNYAAIKPEGLRMHHFDAGLRYQYKGLHLDCEYIYKWYDASGFSPTHAFEGFVYYAFSINKSWLDNVSIALRYDAISPNCTGKVNDIGEYEYDFTRQRITAGVSMFFIERPFKAGIRLNYEKNFFPKDVTCDQDRIILEFIVHY